MNRVSGDETGGTYQLLQTFTMPDSDGPEAAMVLEGTWSAAAADDVHVRVLVLILFALLKSLVGRPACVSVAQEIHVRKLHSFIPPKVGGLAATNTLFSLYAISNI